MQALVVTDRGLFSLRTRRGWMETWKVVHLAVGNKIVKEEGSMKHLPGVLTAGLVLALFAAGPANASKKAPTKAKNSGIVTCPIMKHEFAKGKGIPVKTQSGKTVYVCCKQCVAAAKLLK
jgi:hypothetical protein